MTDAFIDPFNELDFRSNGGYPSVATLTAVDDLVEKEIGIKRWKANGGQIKLRVKALSLEQQDRINYGAAIRHPKTKEWIRGEAEFAVQTLCEGVIVPRMDAAQANLMRAHNPAIIDQLVRYIWLLSRLPDDLIEKYATSPDDPPAPDDAAGTTDESVA